MTSRITRGVLVAMSVALTTPASADEGQWTPDQIPELGLPQKGLAVPLESLYRPDDQGLLAAIVNYDGCSASFVSPDGLVITNHHCAYDDLHDNATPEHDYVKDGFLARRRDEELRTPGRLLVLEEVRDVSGEMRAVVEAEADDRARHRALEQKDKALVAACEAEPGHRCQVASFYAGSVYRLFRYLELRDVRIVYAPPAAIGEYGGEIDNWMWPRHTGDVAFLRAYVGPDGAPAPPSDDNVPYQPKRHLQIAADGVRPGDLVMITGYPYRTRRHLPAVEVKRYLEQELPLREALYREWLDILGRQALRSEAVALKVAAIDKSLANAAKNASGMLAGARRMHLLREREARDARLASEDPGGVLAAMAALSSRRAASYPRHFLLAAAQVRGPSLLPTAIDLVRMRRERDKPDPERAEPYATRDRGKLWTRIHRRFVRVDAEVEVALLTSLVERSEGAGIAAFDELRALGPEALHAALVAATTTSQLGDEARVRPLFDHPELPLDEGAPLIALAAALVPDIEAMEVEDEALEGAEAKLGPAWFELLRAHHDGPLYPDANGTLRLSYATVQGYAPRDALLAAPQTRLAGQLEKYTGRAPFDLPADLLAAVPEAASSHWVDPGLGDVPVCFLSNGDTTGGNSGSATLNARGELVGLNFDRVWENIAGDLGYNPPLSRNVMVDIRYVLFLLDRVDHADELLRELRLERYRSLPPRPRSPASPDGVTPAASPVPPRQAVASGPLGCGFTRQPVSPLLAPPSIGWLAIVCGLALRRRDGKPQRSRLS